MTSHCQNCGQPKAMNMLAENYCDACTSAVAGAMAAATADGKDPWAAKRNALAQRAHNANRNFVDPRAIDAKTIWMHGNRPVPAE